MKRYAFATTALMVLLSLIAPSQSTFADTVVTVTIDSATPTVIPLPGVHVGDSIFVQIFAHTINPFEEPGPLIVQSSGGYSRAFPFEQHILDHFIATQDGEIISAFIQGADGDESATISLILISSCGVTYDGMTNCNDLDSGFDKTNPDTLWLSVAVGQMTEVAKARISLAVNTSDVTFKSADTSKATVLPAQASDSPQVLQVTGRAAGETQIEARLRDQGPVCSALNVAVFNKPTVRVAVHIITSLRRPKACQIPDPQTTRTQLQAALKEIWDQAVVDFDVIRFDEFDFNLGGDCKLDVAFSYLPEEAKNLSDAASDPNASINIFYVPALKLVDTLPDGVANGIAYRKSRIVFIGDFHENSTGNITAHEVGHVLGLNHVPHETSLMFAKSRSTNPCILRKFEWDVSNGKAHIFSPQTAQNVSQEKNISVSDKSKALVILSELEQGNSTRVDEFLAIGNEAIPLLLERLKDKRPEIRRNALELLGRIDLRGDGMLNHDQVIHAMVKAIDDSESNRDVAHTALWYLSGIGPSKVTSIMVQALLLQLQKGEPLAARILGQVGDASLRPILEPYLSSNNKALAELTRQALAKLGDQQYLSGIVSELDSDDVDVRSDAFEKLAYIRNRTTVRKIAQFLWNTDILVSPNSDVGLIPYRFLAADALAKIVDKPPVKSTPSGVCTDEEIQLWKAWWQSHQQEYP
jgi:HEAT repeats/Matrixin